MTCDTNAHALCRPCGLIFDFTSADLFAEALYCPHCLRRVAVSDRAVTVEELLALFPAATLFQSQ